MFIWEIGTELGKLIHLRMPSLKCSFGCGTLTGLHHDRKMKSESLVSSRD